MTKFLKWRKMTWVLWIWSIIILYWAIVGGISASNSCTHQTYQTACQDGTGLGVLAVLFIGFVGFVFFALIWFMTRPRTIGS